MPNTEKMYLLVILYKTNMTPDCVIGKEYNIWLNDMEKWDL